MIMKVLFSSANTSETFDQRYYVDSQFWDGSGPVFFEIGGEGTLSGPPGSFQFCEYIFMPIPSAVRRSFKLLHSLIGNLQIFDMAAGGYMATLAKQYSALLVALEHRFYDTENYNTSQSHK